MCSWSPAASARSPLTARGLGTTRQGSQPTKPRQRRECVPFCGESPQMYSESVRPGGDHGSSDASHSEQLVNRHVWLVRMSSFARPGVGDSGVLHKAHPTYSKIFSLCLEFLPHNFTLMIYDLSALITYPERGRRFTRHTCIVFSFHWPAPSEVWSPCVFPQRELALSVSKIAAARTSPWPAGSSYFGDCQAHLNPP